jgi:hypothetical protein
MVIYSSFRRFEWRWIYEKFFSTNLYPTTLSDAIRYADDILRDDSLTFFVDDDADGGTREITAADGTIIPCKHT